MKIEYTGSHFWKVPTSYQPGQTLQLATIAKFESHFKVKLPESYKGLMLEQNGGELGFPNLRICQDDEVIIPYFYELELNSGVGLSHVFSEELGLPRDLLFLSGDLHTWMALDYRHNNTPKVIYLSESDAEAGRWEEEILAHSFDEFLSKLYKVGDLATGNR